MFQVRAGLGNGMSTLYRGVARNDDDRIWTLDSSTRNRPHPRRPWRPEALWLVGRPWDVEVGPGGAEAAHPAGSAVGLGRGTVRVRRWSLARDRTAVASWEPRDHRGHAGGDRHRPPGQGFLERQRWIRVQPLPHRGRRGARVHRPWSLLARRRVANPPSRTGLPDRGNDRAPRWRWRHAGVAQPPARRPRADGLAARRRR